jgi:hypothetical protein
VKLDLTPEEAAHLIFLLQDKRLSSGAEKFTPKIIFTGKRDYDSISDLLAALRKVQR